MQSHFLLRENLPPLSGCFFFSFTGLPPPGAGAEEGSCPAPAGADVGMEVHRPGSAPIFASCAGSDGGVVPLHDGCFPPLLFSKWCSRVAAFTLYPDLVYLFDKLSILLFTCLLVNQTDEPNPGVFYKNNIVSDKILLTNQMLFQYFEEFILFSVKG